MCFYDIKVSTIEQNIVAIKLVIEAYMKPMNKSMWNPFVKF